MKYYQWHLQPHNNSKVPPQHGVVASSLNIGEKIILGKYNNENIPWEVVAKNHYNNNDVNLWTPYSIGTTQFNETYDTAESIDYRNSIPKTLCQNIYNSFTEKEKDAVLLTTLPTCVANDGTVVNIEDHVFLYSNTELDATAALGDIPGDTGCTSFNFTNDQKNARTKLSDGSWAGGSTRYGRTWSRSAYISSSFVVVMWGSAFSFTTSADSTCGFAPSTNISSSTILYKHSDNNYYLDKEEGEQLTVNNLPLRSLLDIEGKRFILMAKNHEGHPDNSATLILEKIYNSQVFGTGIIYQDSPIRTFLQTDFLNLFSNKDLFLNVTFKTKDLLNDTYYELEDKFFLLSSTEVGFENDANEGSNFGFTSNADRIAYRLDNNAAYYWWLRTPHSSSRVRFVVAVGSLAYNSPSISGGVRPACCISKDNKVTKNDDGSYSVVDSIIIFTISESISATETTIYNCTARNGMTWEEWYNSEYYNLPGYINISDLVLISTDQSQKDTDVIIHSEKYEYTGVWYPEPL